MTDISLTLYMNEQLDLTPTEFKRYKATEIDWNLRLACLGGPRGVGKSIMVLQHILEMQETEKSLYVSADHSFFTTHSLIEVADEFVKDVGEHLYIDEVHKHDGWSRELKQIYDTHPSLKVFVIGSSILDLLKVEADLSRRMVIIDQNAPYKPEATALANEIRVSRNDIPEYLFYMEQAGMLGQLRDTTGGMRGLGKVEKVFLGNTNVVRDVIEYVAGNIIPLWAFGLLY